ncbi:hypothetical protein GGS24DRAFT_290195 [Hypoxylon argillaceum]|nr:hypothetical protein GGS24DRAFT_290195 [Hypoxylon argillaceum]
MPLRSSSVFTDLSTYLSSIPFFDSNSTSSFVASELTMDIFTTCTSVIAIMNAVFRLKQQIRQVSALGDLRGELAELSRVVTSVTETLEDLDFGSPTSTQMYEHAVCHSDCANTMMNREKTSPLLSKVRKLLEDCSATIDELQSRDRSRRHVRIAAKGYPRVVLVPLRDQNIYACLRHYAFRLKALKTALDSCVRDTPHAISGKKESSTGMLDSKEKDRQMIDIVSWLRARTGTTLLTEDGRKQGKTTEGLRLYRILTEKVQGSMASI